MVRPILENTLLAVSGFVIGLVIAAALASPADQAREEFHTIDWMLDRVYSLDQPLAELRYVTFDEVETVQ